MPGQHFGLFEALKKPHIRGFTVKCSSIKGKVWLISQRYLIDEASTLTRRKMREIGQTTNENLIERTKCASDITKFINKETVNTRSTENEDEEANSAFRKQLREAFVDIVSDNFLLTLYL